VFSLPDFMADLGLLLEGEKSMREQTYDPTFLEEVRTTLGKLKVQKSVDFFKDYLVFNNWILFVFSAE
jgi:hypothetical protein